MKVLEAGLYLRCPKCNNTVYRYAAGYMPLTSYFRTLLYDPKCSQCKQPFRLSKLKARLLRPQRTITAKLRCLNPDCGTDWETSFTVPLADAARVLGHDDFGDLVNCPKCDGKFFLTLHTRCSPT